MKSCGSYCNLKNNLPLFIYPNPLIGECIVKASDKLTVTLNTIKITDVAGKIVMQKNGFSTTEIKLNRKQLPQGQQIFIIQCSDNNGVLYTGKLLVQ